MEERPKRPVPSRAPGAPPGVARRQEPRHAAGRDRSPAGRVGRDLRNPHQARRPTGPVPRQGTIANNSERGRNKSQRQGDQGSKKAGGPKATGRRRSKGPGTPPGRRVPDYRGEERKNALPPAETAHLGGAKPLFPNWLTPARRQQAHTRGGLTVPPLQTVALPPSRQAKHAVSK